VARGAAAARRIEANCDALPRERCPAADRHRAGRDGDGGGGELDAGSSCLGRASHRAGRLWHLSGSRGLSGVRLCAAANLTTIYAEIRDVAHYHGLLVALTYYSLGYSDQTQVAGTEALNSAIASVTEKFGGKVADGFAAFEGPSAAFGGSPCAAGLLIKLPDGTCNIHPSPAGHLLLAQAIEDVI
jgi:hypothetical protein